MTDTRQIAPGEYRPSSDGGFTAVSVEPYTRQRDGSPSQLIRWRGKCVHCGAAYEVHGRRQCREAGEDPASSIAACGRPRAGKQNRAGTRALLRCVRMMIQPAIRQLSEGRTEARLSSCRLSPRC